MTDDDSMIMTVDGITSRRSIWAQNIFSLKEDGCVAGTDDTCRCYDVWSAKTYTMEHWMGDNFNHTLDVPGMNL